LRGDDGGVLYYGSMEACAPEQLGDGRVGAYTDVYALGALTFRLLTGRPVFTAESPEALLEQHLYAQPVQLRSVRAGLPVALDGVIQTALAKDPTRRFAQPGAFADAYQQVVAPNSMMRVSFSATPGSETARPRANLSDPSRAPSRPRGSGALRAPTITALDARPDGSTASRPLAIDAQWIDDEMLAARKRRKRSKRAVWQVAVAVALVIIVAANALFLSGAFSHNKTAIGAATGDIEFLDSSSSTSGATDAVQIVLRNVSAPAAGHAYYAWIINQAAEQTAPLGRLTPTKQTYTLRYVSPAVGAGAGANLLTLGDKIEVTLEQGTVALPVGKVILSATFPPQAFVHIQHLLVSFPTTPGKIGLLVGVLDQTQEVEAQATLLQNAASAANAAAVQCGAQSILDIIEGAQGPHYRPLSAACQALNITLTGDGFGLLDVTQADQSTNAGTGYLDGASDHASLAATAPDATPDIKLHAGHVEIAVANIKRWLLTADQDALKLAAAPTNSVAVADLVAVSDHAYHGVSVNGDQTIDPVNGQAGAVTAYEHGQFMATLTLTAAATK
ncbi:MAG TPA: hypothetical protein VJN88_09795, partial [Ktedonobacterales bacterium]|nr:hypothetical protein [Ktedonobacterales bacterium]